MQKRGSRLPMMAGASLAGVGWLVALLLPGTVPQMIVLLCVISFGTSVLNAAIPNAIVAAVPESRTSEAMGTTMVVMGLAGAIGAQIVAVLLASDTILAPDGGAAFPSVGGFRLTMMWIAALTFGAAACGLLLSPRRPLPEPAPAGAG
jgi:MFS family permease